MGGLLKKDMYVLWSSMRVFMILTLVFALVPQGFTQGFAIMYASMVPITAIAYDERSKWGQLAAMMPYKKSDLVLSKYLIGTIGSVVMCMLVIMVNFIYSSLGIETQMPMPDGWIISIIVFAVSQILLGINLPLVIKLGAEKGRIFYLLITVVIVLITVNFIQIDSFSIKLSKLQIVGIAVVIAAIVWIISLKLSNKFYTAESK